jgi:RNA recognition motif-containing protein
MNIYVGNLSLHTTELELRDLFREFGRVISTKILTDMDTGQSKGFGFVEMDDASDGVRAIKKLNNMNFMSQTIQVSEAVAQPKGK